jgi:hypothetical protein
MRHVLPLLQLREFNGLLLNPAAGFRLVFPLFGTAQADEQSQTVMRRGGDVACLVSFSAV